MHPDGHPVSAYVHAQVVSAQIDLRHGVRLYQSDAAVQFYPRHGAVLLHQRHGAVLLHQRHGVVLLHQRHGVVLLHQRHGVVRLHQRHDVVRLHPRHDAVRLYRRHDVVRLYQSHAVTRFYESPVAVYYRVNVPLSSIIQVVVKSSGITVASTSTIAINISFQRSDFNMLTLLVDGIVYPCFNLLRIVLL